MKLHWNGVLLFASTVVCLALQLDDRSARIKWLSDNAVPVRSIDPTIANDDFADLKPLLRMIGKSRVVMLGEQSHGDGATFLAKSRMVKFLHQCMGFDVLAWEAGEFNSYDMNAAVRDTSVAIEDAMARGLFPVWANSAQVRPVFEYARLVSSTDRPLEIVGFDHQFSGTRSSSRWRDAFLEFLDKADSTILPPPLRLSLKHDLRDVVFKQDSKPSEIRLVAEKWNLLPRLLDSARAELLKVHSEREVALMRRSVDDALVSIEGMARMREASGTFRAADNNLRDQRMGENLIWLANDFLKGHRIIVWAAAFHTLSDPSAIKLDSGAGFSYQGVLTMGQVARSSLKESLYTIAFTAAEGKAGDATGGRMLDIDTPADSSFEGLCLTLEHRFLFVDLRQLPTSHWLRQPTLASPLNYSPIETDWSRQVDALMFLRTMFPSTKGSMAPQGAVLTEGLMPQPRGR